MSTTMDVMDKLHIEEGFDRNGLAKALESAGYPASDGNVRYMLSKLMNNGSVIRVGRNSYQKSGKKRSYQYKHSNEALGVANEILAEHPFLDFRVFELIQLNEFVNHQIAHNTIFVSVESGVEDFVFSSLWAKHTGNVMLKPKEDEFFRYHTDDMIVVGKLVSESPKGASEFWDTRIEKMLVDVLADKLLSKMISEGEYDNIFRDAVRKYAIDVNTLKRYARRRGALNRMAEVLDENDICLEGINK